MTKEGNLERKPLRLREIEPIWLDTEQLCEYLSISRGQSYELRKQGLPYCKIGKLVRFDKRKVDRFMRNHEVRDRPAEDVLSELRTEHAG